MVLRKLFKLFNKKNDTLPIKKEKNREVWIITGCSSGFGKELCIELLKKGYKVGIGLRNKNRLQYLKEQFPLSALLLEMDVTNESQIKEAVQKTIETFGKIDVLVNNAGCSYFSSIEESNEAEVKKLFDVNVWGYIKATKAVLPHMRKRAEGLIINISSVTGIEAFPGVTFYSASKFAIEGFSQALKKEVSPLGIDVLSINPSAARTPISTKLKLDYPQIPEYKEILKEGIHTLENQLEFKYSKISPQKVALEIIEISKYESMPTNIFLGTDCLNIVNNKVKTYCYDIKASKDFATRIEYEEGI